MTRRETLGSVVAAGLVLRLNGNALAAGFALTTPVEIASGRIRGKRANGVSTFLGIPYGQDTRQRRFQPALPALPWTGVRDCVTLGHQAPQMEPGAGAGGPGANLDAPFVKQVITIGRQGMEIGNEGEDCLVLNVYTPDASRRRARPVMVWLHGGGFAIGSAGDPQYDGSALASGGDVVVVTVNHRLNALGYLYLGEIDPAFADSGNVGQLDIVLALQWVRDNIAALGGDPGNVTIFGESGGGAKVSTLLAMPPAHGLFHKAIIQSGPALTALAKGPATEHARKTLAGLKIAPADVRRLQTIDTVQLIAAAKAAQGPGMGMRLLGPVVDGRSLPSDPFTPTAPAISRDVPVMIGTTATEGTLFLAADPAFGTMTEAQARQRAALIAGPRGNAAIDLYKRLRPNDPPTYWATATMTDHGAWIDSIRLAERKLARGGAPVYMYRLDWRAPMLNGALRSPHGLDVPLVFDNVAARPLMMGSGPDPQRIASAMSTAWIDFARTGDPSQRGLAWPAYETKRRDTMIFDVRSHVATDPDGEVRRFWSS